MVVVSRLAAATDVKTITGAVFEAVTEVVIVAAVGVATDVVELAPIIHEQRLAVTHAHFVAWTGTKNIDVLTARGP